MHIMSSYHSSFKYLDKKSDEDFGWIIAHFDPDNGETDSYLSQEQIYSDSYNGTKRTLYGTKYTTVANVKITVIKQDGSDFSLSECRNAYKWLTGNPEASWMDLYVGDEVKYRLLCTIQDVKPQKIDARTVGLNIYCESLSPWAYSPVQTITKQGNGGGGITLKNESDDMYSFIYPKVIFTNTTGSTLMLYNKGTKEKTEVLNIGANETITLHQNQFITSDKPNKMFSNTFNFVWPRLKPGDNVFSINATGELTFEYYWPIKMGDCAITMNSVSDPICSEDGAIQIDMLDWERISNTPTTLGGYGISDAYPMSAVYNKNEINSQIKTVSDEAKSAASLASTVSSQLTNYKNYVDDNYYTKSEIDNIVAELEYDPSTGDSNAVTWSQVIGKPTTLSGYGVKSEVQGMIDLAVNEIDAYTKSETYSKSEVDAKIASVDVSIDEQELNDMLEAILGESSSGTAISLPNAEGILF